MFKDCECMCTHCAAGNFNRLSKARKASVRRTEQSRGACFVPRSPFHQLIELPGQHWYSILTKWKSANYMSAAVGMGFVFTGMSVCACHQRSATGRRIRQCDVVICDIHLRTQRTRNPNLRLSVVWLVERQAPVAKFDRPTDLRRRHSNTNTKCTAQTRYNGIFGLVEVKNWKHSRRRSCAESDMVAQRDFPTLPLLLCPLCVCVCVRLPLSPFFSSRLYRSVSLKKSYSKSGLSGTMTATKARKPHLIRFSIRSYPVA